MLTIAAGERMHGADEMRKRVEETAALECLAVEDWRKAKDLGLVVRAERVDDAVDRISVSSNAPLRP